MPHRNLTRAGWRLIPAIAAMVLLVGLSAYGQSPPVEDDTWDNVERSEPSLSLSVIGPGQGQVYRGWPMLIRLEVWHPRIANRKAAPLILAAKDGPWSGALKLEVKNEQGQAQPWPIHLASAAEKTLTLNATNGGEIVWWLSPDETVQFPDGKYRLHVTLDTTQSTVKDGWKGKALSEPLPIHLQSPPTQLDEEQQLAKSFITASYQVVRKDFKQAAATIDELLKRRPDNIRGLAFKGDLLTADGKTQEAFSLYQQALEAYEKKYPKSKQPPIFLLNKQKALLDKLIREPR